MPTLTPLHFNKTQEATPLPGKPQYMILQTVISYGSGVYVTDCGRFKIYKRANGTWGLLGCSGYINDGAGATGVTTFEFIFEEDLYDTEFETRSLALHALETVLSDVE